MLNEAPSLPVKAWNFSLQLNVIMSQKVFKKISGRPVENFFRQPLGRKYRYYFFGPNFYQQRTTVLQRLSMYCIIYGTKHQ